MSRRRQTWGEGIRVLGEEVAARIGSHPSPATLLAYHRRELPPEEAEAVAEHLAWCQDDAELLRDLSILEGEEAAVDLDPALVGDPEVEWAALRQRLAETAAPVPGAPLAVPPQWRWPPGRGLLALAASLTLVVGLAAGWGLGRIGSEGPGEPVPDVPLHDLSSAGGERSAAPPVPRVVLDRHRDRAVLVLSPVGELPTGPLRLRLLPEGSGRPVWEGIAHPTSPGTLTLEVFYPQLEPGLHVVEVRTLDGHPLDRFRFEVVAAPLASPGP